jgi:2-keto-4-pentenoate hydratase/2-oxohepta-3-ene-1,7-dioic acid hydratase in catechol pathway
MKLKPSKIICVGLNYKDHAKELNLPQPASPVIFMKPLTTLIGHGGQIVYPPLTKDLHYEAELAVIIKDRCKNVSEQEAPKHIRGFTCANDVTARDLQNLDGQWTRAKSFDTFCPVEPEVVSGVDPNNLPIKLYLNGELKQSSNTSNMIFNVYYLVSFISRVMTLEAGDIILTGTPPGVGPMQVGDIVMVEIEGIGKLTNKVKSF